MTSTPDLNIAGSPIYESLVATTGDPYLPDVPYPHGYGYPAPALLPMAAANPGMLSQLLNRVAGDGQSWVALLMVGGPAADQLRQYQQYQQYQAYQAYHSYQSQQAPQQPADSPQSPAVAVPEGYAGYPGPALDGGTDTMAQLYQLYQNAHDWGALHQAMIAAERYTQAIAPSAAPMYAAPAPAYTPPMYTPPAYAAPVNAVPMNAVPMNALPAAAAPSTAADETPIYGGMLTQDWAGWLGQTSQSLAPPPPEPPRADARDTGQEDRQQEPPYERRGGRLSSRLGAAMRELRGR